MRTHLGPILVLASCGPAGPMDTPGTTGSTSAATSSTTDPTSTDAITSTTSTAATSTSTSTSTATSTSPSTGAESGESTSTAAETGESSTTADPTTGGSSTGEPTGVVYTAEYYLGQVNRITVYRADFDADNCASIKFAEGGPSDPNAPVTLPPFWGVEWTQVSQGTAGCTGGEPGLDWEQADSAMGMADFDLSMSCTIDIDVIATYPQTAPWVPMNIHFLATEVPIEGIC